MQPLQEPSPQPAGFAFFQLAFRPFFSAGALFAVLSIAFWIVVWTQENHWQAYGNPVWWHAHELIFGFAAAIIVGFLLTAVQTWTGLKAIHGTPLFILFLVWLLPRFLLFLPIGLPPVLIAIIDMLFLTVAALLMAYPVLKVKQKRNFAFAPILLLLATLNGVSHYSLFSQNYLLSMNTLHAAIMLITVLVSVIGGRIIPSFTANATDYTRKNTLLIIDVLAIASLLCLSALALIGLSRINSELVFTLCVIGCIAHTIRWLRWGGLYTLKTPLLWSLHLSYCFIPLGLALLAFWSIDLIQHFSAVLHTFTVGSMAGMILAMISRVSLGHTGRALKAPKIMTIAFAAIALAALTRSIGPILLPTYFNETVLVSGFLWLLAFGLFFIFYIPYLVKTRVDGLPG